MEHWKILLPKITAVLQHAEENPVANQFVKLHLDDLKDLAYDMEDILEEFVIDAKRSKLSAESEAKPNKLQKIISSVFFGSRAKPNPKLDSMVNDLSVRLQKIHDGMRSLDLANLNLKLEDESHKVAAKRLPESSLLEDIVLGRDSDKEDILQRLLEDGGNLKQDFVIPIVGMGGLGKTTLARLIYNDKRLEGKFDFKAWVCVSDEFDVAQITRTILEHVTRTRYDIWNKEYGQWDVLKRPFMSGAPGSKIIVTTRNNDVGTMMRGDDGVYNLELLQDDACLPLFTQHALGKENFDAHPNLQDVGEKLVKRCKRLPLALKTLGGVLRGKLHPDYEFDKKELVLLWMAEGLLPQQSHGKKQMPKEIGDQYFQDLLSRSLFQQSSGDESQFVMHDLINDLAIDVAGEIYCNLGDSMGDEKLEKARHVSFIPHYHEISERFMVLKKLKHLRTFLPLQGFHHYPPFLSNIVVHHFLPTLNHLRVLSLCNYRISKLPADFFGNLKHIRYINFSGTHIKCIPESVGSLLFLQTLLLHGCHKLTELPATIGNLIDLHNLDITDTESLKAMPSEICNLKNLVTLSKVIVGEASGLMRLSDLKNFLQLQGTLSLLDLQNVLDVQDAKKANLDKIHGLEELVLEWTTSDNDGDELVLEMQVLSWLKPHSNLKSLKISCYGGYSFPNWVCDPSLFSNLSYMEFTNCERCTLLPSLGQLFALKKLIITGMKAIKAVGLEFYGQHEPFRSLEELVFQDMTNWKEWTSPAESASTGEFPCLLKLVIEDCPELVGQLPGNLSSLKELHVRRCNEMLLNSMGDLTSLVNLRIEKISKLTCLPKSFTQSLIALETLNITCCHDLTSLWEERAEIEQSLLPFNLKHLSLMQCTHLESLPNAMMVQMDGSSSSDTSMLTLRLEKLEISGCHSLNSFPRGKLPSTLTYLKIEDCDCLESLPEADGDNDSKLYLEIKNLPCLYSSEGCHQLPVCLKKFTTDKGGELLESFLERMLQHCMGLQCIEITNCKTLKSLPILDCVSSLVKLWIEQCEVFESLPNMMNQLKSLQTLSLVDCPGIEFIPDGSLPPNLINLYLIRCKNLKRVPNTMYQLTSLQSLSMPSEALTMGFGRDLQNLTSLQYLIIEQKLPLNIVLPSSLTTLGIYCQENLESIPKGLFQNLNSLNCLEITDCPKLQFLPREGFPPSLGLISMFSCPLLERQRFKETGDYCTLTRTIPCIWIDDDQVIRPSVN
ncbi:hypothetical protein SLEP1_g49294 [Rubroshorea leprosula]|uniref:Disease resistance RPP13-like protein 1 n=1 Tax=Rubroshorea leprosula TaxID=152421 RepID=A0AAV5LZL2_9ROSI|nr:hypothetical protein SLEP1_g49294 [Rubroshorea leprosula]